MTLEALEDPKWSEDEPELCDAELWWLRWHMVPSESRREWRARLQAAGYLDQGNKLTPKARAALAADRERRRQEPDGEWRTDLENAPVDTNLLVVDQDGDMYIAHKTSDHAIWYESDYAIRPICWRHLPKGPVRR